MLQTTTRRHNAFSIKKYVQIIKISPNSFSKLICHWNSSMTIFAHFGVVYQVELLSGQCFLAFVADEAIRVICFAIVGDVLDFWIHQCLIADSTFFCMKCWIALLVVVVSLMFVDGFTCSKFTTSTQQNCTGLLILIFLTRKLQTHGFLFK